MSDKAKSTWLINGLLAVILVLLVGNYARSHSMPWAQAAGGGWETDGYMVMPARGGQAERLVLIDTKNKRMVVYKERNAGSFGLTGARNYQYDMELEDSEGKIKGNGWTYLEARYAYETAKTAKP